jgi:hypothetical protein
MLPAGEILASSLNEVADEHILGADQTVWIKL